MIFKIRTSYVLVSMCNTSPKNYFERNILKFPSDSIISKLLLFISNNVDSRQILF